jgi:hypothetical protein
VAFVLTFSSKRGGSALDVNVKVKACYECDTLDPTYKNDKDRRQGVDSNHFTNK